MWSAITYTVVLSFHLSSLFIFLQLIDVDNRFEVNPFYVVNPCMYSYLLFFYFLLPLLLLLLLKHVLCF